MDHSLKAVAMLARRRAAVARKSVVEKRIIFLMTRRNRHQFSVARLAFLTYQ